MNPFQNPLVSRGFFTNIEARDLISSRTTSEMLPALCPQMTDSIKIHFDHGLGDAVHFAAHLYLSIQRGYKFEVACTPDKAILFEAAGCKVRTARITPAYTHVPWHEVD